VQQPQQQGLMAVPPPKASMLLLLLVVAGRCWYWLVPHYLLLLLLLLQCSQLPSQGRPTASKQHPHHLQHRNVVTIIHMGRVALSFHVKCSSTLSLQRLNGVPVPECQGCYVSMSCAMQLLQATSCQAA
jgi:hypothetical protein